MCQKSKQVKMQHKFREENGYMHLTDSVNFTLDKKKTHFQFSGTVLEQSASFR